jgi:hypothetical protein
MLAKDLNNNEPIMMETTETEIQNNLNVRDDENDQLLNDFGETDCNPISKNVEWNSLS